MPADFEAEARNGLRTLRTEVDALKRGVTELNQTTRNYGNEAANAFRHHVGLHETREKAEALSESLHELGHATKSVGGSVGEVIHRLTGGLGLSGAFGVLSVAGGAAHLVMERFNEDLEHLTETAKTAAEAAENVFKAHEAADAALNKQSEAGLAQAPGRRRLLGLGGKYALDRVDKYAADGIVSDSDAQAGVAAAYGAYHHSDRTDQILDTAYDLAKRGVGFQDAVSRLIQHGGDLKDPAARRRIAATVYNQAIGSRNNDVYNYDAAGGNVEGDALLNAAAGVGRNQHELHGLERQRAIERGEGQSLIALNNAKDPLAAAIFALVQATNANLEKQAEIAEYLRGKEKQGIVNGSLWDTIVARYAAGQATKEARLARERADAAGVKLSYPPGGG